MTVIRRKSIYWQVQQLRIEVNSQLHTGIETPLVLTFEVKLVHLLFRNVWNVVHNLLSFSYPKSREKDRFQGLKKMGFSVELALLGLLQLSPE